MSDHRNRSLSSRGGRSLSRGRSRGPRNRISLRSQSHAQSQRRLMALHHRAVRQAARQQPVVTHTQADRNQTVYGANSTIRRNLQESAKTSQWRAETEGLRYMEGSNQRAPDIRYYYPRPSRASLHAPVFPTGAAQDRHRRSNQHHHENTPNIRGTTRNEFHQGIDRDEIEWFQGQRKRNERLNSQARLDRSIAQDKGDYLAGRPSFPSSGAGNYWDHELHRPQRE